MKRMLTASIITGTLLGLGISWSGVAPLDAALSERGPVKAGAHIGPSQAPGRPMGVAPSTPRSLSVSRVSTGNPNEGTPPGGERGPRQRSLAHHQTRKAIRKRAQWSLKAAIRLHFDTPRVRAQARRISRCEYQPRVPVSQGGAPWPDNRNAKRGQAGERSGVQIHPVHSNWVDMDKLERSAYYAVGVMKRMWLNNGKRFQPMWTCATILGIR